MTYSPPSQVDDRPITILGAGTLGRRIALTFATRGGTVHLYDVDEDSLKAAEEYLSVEVPLLVEKRGTSATAATIEFFTDLQAAVRGAWYVIESVPEVQSLKIDVLGQLDQIVESDAIIGTNSSSFRSSELIEKVLHPERVLNTHYGQPPELAQVELMTDGKTDPRIYELLEKELPKHGFVTAVARRESVGFIVNRVWAAVKREAIAVVADGVTTPSEFDRLWVASGFGSVGIFRMIDKVGLDVALDIEDNYIEHFPFIPTTSRDLLRTYVRDGKLGVKSGEGFYDDYSA